jgi:hypothetical protein
MADADLQNFLTVGARRFPGALLGSMAQLETALSDFAPDKAGIRIHGQSVLRALLESDGCIGAIAAQVLGPVARPVRAILFNKTPKNNWALAWHQDRTICVKEPRKVAGFGPWTVKSGLHHVSPPFDLLTRMVTLRAHLDDVPEGNGPLLIAPGSHLLGRVSESGLDGVVKQCGTTVCLAEAGDVWLYATPIVHGSKAASKPGKRRVLQIDYAAELLPGGLQWLEV